MGRELARGSCELRPQGVQLYSHIWLSCMHAYCMYVAKNPSKILQMLHPRLKASLIVILVLCMQCMYM